MIFFNEEDKPKLVEMTVDQLYDRCSVGDIKQEHKLIRMVTELIHLDMIEKAEDLLKKGKQMDFLTLSFFGGLVLIEMTMYALGEEETAVLDYLLKKYHILE